MDSIEIHLDKNFEIIQRMEQNTDILEKFVMANPILNDEDSFDKFFSRPELKSFESKNEPFSRSFQLKQDKSADSLMKKLYVPYKVIWFRVFCFNTFSTYQRMI